MSNFVQLTEKLRAMKAIGPRPECAGLVGPLARGETAAAAVLILNGGQVLHRQPRHEELLIVLEGEAEFRVGDEVRHIAPGDFVFVPRDAVHGTVGADGAPLALLSILTPQFDLARDMVLEPGVTPPAYQLV